MEDLELGEIAIIVALIAGVVYLLYEAFNKLSTPSPDPGGGAPGTTLLDNLLNQLEIGKSSESEASATQEVIANPFTSVGTIVGGWWNDLTGDAQEY